MERITKDETSTTPLLTWHPEEGQLSIVGRSIDENSDDFFGPLETSLTEYEQKPAETTRVIIALEYMNTPTVGYLSRILRRMAELHNTGKTDLEIKWHYEDVESGQKTVIKIVEAVIGHEIKRIPYDD